MEDFSFQLQLKKENKVVRNLGLYTYPNFELPQFRKVLFKRKYLYNLFVMVVMSNLLFLRGGLISLHSTSTRLLSFYKWWKNPTRGSRLPFSSQTSLMFNTKFKSPTLLIWSRKEAYFIIFRQWSFLLFVQIHHEKGKSEHRVHKKVVL